MKKNITINLYGQLYAIDDDAYQLLECYLDSMKRHFKRQDGGEEIADDVEHRIAEILWEKKENGQQTVDIDTIRAIIKQIGNPSEIDNGDGDEETANGSFGDKLKDTANAAVNEARNVMGDVNCHLKKRRLYRDGQNKIFGGVCAGLGYYFGGQDPTIWRIVTVLLTFLSVGTSLLVYIVMWLVVPLAKTPEDRLRMKGLDVNERNLSEEASSDNQKGNETSGCLKFALVVAAVLLVLYLALPVISAVLMVPLLSQMLSFVTSIAL